MNCYAHGSFPEEGSCPVCWRTKLPIEDKIVFVETWDKNKGEYPIAQMVHLAEYVKLQQECKRYRDALNRLDEWQGQLICEASVYHVCDDEWGHMQFLIHEALR